MKKSVDQMRRAASWLWGQCLCWFLWHRFSDSAPGDQRFASSTWHPICARCGKHWQDVYP